jgi:fumarate hydratase class I
MEAVWKIDVVDFPAFIVVDDKGNDFFADLTGTESPKPSAAVPRKLDLL